MRVIEATGSIHSEAARFLTSIRSEIEKESRLRIERSKAISAQPFNSAPKSIDAFRSNPAYCGDGTRVDLAYALYALSHGVSDSEIKAALSSRDLSHKGNEHRQQQYLERTLKKAALLLEKQHGRGLGR